MNERIPWILIALLCAGLLWTHVNHGQRIDQLNRELSGPEHTAKAATGTPNDRPALLARVQLLETQLAEMKQRRGGRHAKGPSSSLHARGLPGGQDSARAAPEEGAGDGEQVLEVLESDDPNVRERLRDVIDDELTARRESAAAAAHG